MTTNITQNTVTGYQRSTYPGLHTGLMTTGILFQRLLQIYHNSQKTII